MTFSQMSKDFYRQATFTVKCLMTFTVKCQMTFTECILYMNKYGNVHLTLNRLVQKI